MTTARLLSKRPLARDMPDGRWTLEEDLIVDLGVRVKELHMWQNDKIHEGRPPKYLRIARTDVRSTMITVFSGITTDFSSIPILAQLVMGDKSHYRIAGAVHDALYRDQAPRGPSDGVWQRIAESGDPHVSEFRAILGHTTLRIVGKRSYNRYRVTA